MAHLKKIRLDRMLNSAIAYWTGLKAAETGRLVLPQELHGTWRKRVVVSFVDYLMESMKKTQLMPTASVEVNDTLCRICQSTHIAIFFRVIFFKTTPQI
jgi:hypothetical protein